MLFYLGLEDALGGQKGGQGAAFVQQAFQDLATAVHQVAGVLGVGETAIGDAAYATGSLLDEAGVDPVDAGEYVAVFAEFDDER